MPAEKKEKVNRPEDSAFKQQRLKAWQPILTPRWVIGTFLCLGLVFIPIGATLMVNGNKVYEQVILYDGPVTAPLGCQITQQNEGYNASRSGVPKNCELTFTVDRDLAANAVIEVYYQLTNFYQNHRRYVKSRSDEQVAGKAVGAGTLQTLCDPDSSFQTRNPANNKTLIYFPCGLIATSYFNDGIFLKRFNNDAPPSGVVMDESNIAWSSDINSKFMNPTSAINQWTTYQYLWQTYDQMTCYNTTTYPLSYPQPCYTWGDLLGNSSVPGSGCAKCMNSSHYARYEGGIPPPGGPNVFDPNATTGSATAPFGLRDEHFINWMRTAGLPTFRKLYGRLKPPTTPGYFKAGDNITFDIVPNFEVKSYDGTKSLVLSTTTLVGGKTITLGIAYVTVGSICWFLAVAFLIKHLVSPRKLGDTKYITWKNKAA